mgnify:FL=1
MLLIVLFYFGVVLISISAAVVTVLAFGESTGDGIRALVVVSIPTVWGAYFLNTYEADSNAWEQIVGSAIPWIGILAGLILSAPLIADSPLWTANIAFGLMNMTFFVMFVSRQPEDQRRWALALLLMVTVIATTAAVTQ